jgi:hypothetical protein
MNLSPFHRRMLLTMLGISALTVLVYLPAMTDEFCVFDDPSYVTGNPYVATGLSWANVKWALTQRHSAMWHPVTSISHMLDVQLFGMNARAQHAVNLLLHIVNSSLLFVVLWQLTGRFGRSAVAAALFALHPLHVESVAWISERKDMLSGLFFFLTLLAHTQYARKGGARRYLLVLLFFTLGMLSKAMLVTLPIVLLLLDYWPLDRLKSRADWKRAVVEKLPMLPVILAIGLVTIHMQQEANAFFPVTLPNRIANAFVSYMRYIGAAFWPANLSIFYPHPGAWPAAVTIASVLGVFAITVVVWLARGRRPYLLVGWLLFLVMLLPVIGLIQVGVQSMADRYMYLPFIGVALAVVWFIADVLKAKQSQAVAALSIVICAMLTWNQANYWRSNEALFTHALDVIGESAYMRNNLAAALWMHGRQAEAIAQRERVVQLSSNSAEAHRALGMDYLAVGRTKESLDQLEQALSIEPENALIYLNLAQYFETTGNIPNAIETLREGARRVPRSQEIKAALKRWSR